MIYNVPLSDLVQFLWVVDDDLDPHLHFGLLQAEVQAGYLSIYNTLHHFCGYTKQAFDGRNRLKLKRKEE